MIDADYQRAKETYETQCNKLYGEMRNLVETYKDHQVILDVLVVIVAEMFVSIAPGQAGISLNAEEFVEEVKKRVREYQVKGSKRISS